MILHCVRHGESTYNAEGRVQGQSDVPLSPLGRRQAEAVAAALAETSLEAIFSSPLRRALETARLAADRTGVELHVDDRLKEVHAGVFQDRLHDELEAMFPDVYRRWTGGDPHYVVPGGESRRQLADRGEAAFREILRSGYREVAVIAHGRLLAVTLRRLVDKHGNSLPSAFQNGSITTLRYDESTGLVIPEAIDRVDHLEAVGLSGQGGL